MSNIKTYQNGNYVVAIDLNSGTKTRENDLDFFKADFPECCDYKITNNCVQGCSFCFPAGVKVKVNEKDIPIEEVNIGDIVDSYNLESQIKELKPVVKLYERDYNGELIKITVEDKTIICTPNHKIYTINRGWVEAGSLTTDDEVMFYD